MSLSKKICKELNKNMTQTRSDGKYSSDSFDRYGDDLCELLLSYLSVEQKKRFECVSKQWQRLVFNKQQKLIISGYKESIDSILLIIDHMPPHKQMYVFAMFENLFKKFKFITELTIDLGINDQVLDIINKSCLSFKKIVFQGEFSEKTLTHFGSKFGQSLEFIKLPFFMWSEKSELKALFPFIKSLKTLDINRNEMKLLLESFLPKLEEIMCLLVKDLNDFKLLTDKYCKQLKKINFWSTLESVSKPHLLTQLSRYQNIESIDLSQFVINEDIDKELIIIGRNCNKLKELSISFHEFKSKSTLFEIFGAFNALEKLKVHSVIDKQLIGSISSLKNCKLLKSLYLRINTLNDQHMDDIHLCLPHLKEISINCANHTNILTVLITDKTLLNLTKMQNLSKVSVFSRKVTESGICHFIKNSLNIKTIHVFNSFINDSTIEAFTERANNNQKIRYEFSNYWYFQNPFNRRITYKGISCNLLIKKRIT